MKTVWTAICFVAAFVLTLTTVSGCGALPPIEVAKRASNAAYGAAPALGLVVEVECTERYKAATAAQVPEIDKACLPLKAAYKALRTAHLAAIAAILSAEQGKPDTAALIATGLALAQAVQAAQEAAAKAGAK